MINPLFSNWEKRHQKALKKNFELKLIECSIVAELYELIIWMKIINKSGKNDEKGFLTPKFYERERNKYVAPSLA